VIFRDQLGVEGDEVDGATRLTRRREGKRKANGQGEMDAGFPVEAGNKQEQDGGWREREKIGE